MIEALGMLGALAVTAVPAGIIGKALDKHIRRREREVHREQARQEQAEIAALYKEVILKQIRGDISNDKPCI